MADDLKIGIRISAESNELVGATKAATAELDKLGDSAKKTSLSASTLNEFSKGLSSQLNTVSPAVARVASRLSALSPIIGGVVAGITALGLGWLAAQRAFEASLPSQIKLEAILGNVGKEIRVTTDEINKFADTMARRTLFDDEQFKDASATLATFTQVTGRTHTRVLDLAASLATLRGGSVESWATSLGRALEQPEQGFLLLKRAGVSFTDAEKEQIKTLTEVGRTMEAQDIQLGKLENAFGSAESAAGSLATKMHDELHSGFRDLRHEFGEFVEDIGKATRTGVFDSWAKTLADAIKDLRTNSLRLGQPEFKLLPGAIGGGVPKISVADYNASTAKNYENQSKALADLVSGLEKETASMGKSAAQKKVDELRTKALSFSYGDLQAKLNGATDAYERAIRKQEAARGGRGRGKKSAESIDVFDDAAFVTKDKGAADFIRNQYKDVNDLTRDILKDQEADFKSATQAADLYKRRLDSLLSDTPIRKTHELQENISLLDEAFANGVIGADEWGQGIDRLTGSTQKLKDDGTEAFKELQRAIEGWGRASADAFVDFAFTGKASFGDLINSMLKDLARMAAYNAFKPLFGAVSESFGKSDFGSFFSGLFGGDSGGGGGGTLFGIKGSANGNVFDSPGLSAYSSQIVSRPTLFPFASGIGLMGEAGPEAILPLSRGRDGKLGVAASGGAGGGITLNQSINVTVQSTGDEKLDGEKIAASLKNSMQKIVDTTLLRERRPGGMLA